MQCPVDGTELVMAERSGVEIDYCPKCRGVWLDRGELDKIIDRGSPPAPAASRERGYEERRESHGEPAQAAPQEARGVPRRPVRLLTRPARRTPAPLLARPGRPARPG